MKIKDSAGSYPIVRDLIDPGSQASFITQKFTNSLPLTRRDNRTVVMLLGQVYTRPAFGSIRCHIRPIHEHLINELSILVIS